MKELLMTEKINEDQQAKIKAQIEGQYAALGKFIQEFGQICNGLRMSFNFLLQFQGLKDQNIAQIIIHNKAITAAPLLEIMAALAGRLIGEDAIGMEILKQIKKRFLDLIEIRNEFAHGDWYIGWGNAEKSDYSEMDAHILKTSKKGIKVKTLPKSEQELLTLVEECKQVNTLCMRFFFGVSMGHEPIKNFTKDKNGQWLPHRPESKPES